MVKTIGIADIYVDKQGHGYVKIEGQTFDVDSTNIRWVVLA